ncbi:hypothetical protein MM221_05710 [Salipaludibacillus sp. LMS25]|uniref:hypothetical protein n=1 Tax=Salipaludibacillus sp. LMS25 TaxID=2924031 RepID=UPI0020D0A595|nr:hypothetical protein [Salipaludibacillus sp. LMS25]UTR16056.1 hypothetical protein MM221_05710 [Salipaludibacillus sp. LMS25]
MYKRIIVAVASTLFILLAFLAVIITDLYDRDFPEAINVESRLTLDFSESGYSINEAFATLKELDAHWDLGLVKVAPDLENDDDSQIFVALSDKKPLTTFTWFGGNDVGQIVHNDRLETSYPDGFYLVTNETKHLGEVEDALRHAGVKVSRTDASIFDSLKFVVWEKGFSAAVLASFALIATLALFWLSLRARGRALRVLGGSPTIRIQMQDLSGFGIALIVSAFAVALVSAGYVGIFHGWMYVGTFLKALISLEVAVLVVSLLAALIMSATAWPSATMIATRQPAVKSLRSAAIVIQALTFLLVVSAAGPSWSAYKHSSAMADEMAQWKQLADQVALVFATDMDDMERMEPQIGELVKDAESQDEVALSYTYTQDMIMPGDFGEYSVVSFVNQNWLDVVTKHASEQAVTSVPYNDIPDDLIQMIQGQVDLLSRENSEDLLAQFQFLQPVDGFQLPVAQGGGGERLHFVDDALVVVVPSLYDTFNDSSLTSMASSRNLTFTGVTATQQLLINHDLDVQSLRDSGFNGELNVAYIAEDGILQAQFAAYVVWLQNLALMALIVAFSVATAISALITALLKAKHDFPLRLAGHSWRRILQSRVMKELLVGVGLVCLVILFQGVNEIESILVVAVYGFVVVPLSHLFTTRWCFNGVSRRRI